MKEIKESNHAKKLIGSTTRPLALIAVTDPDLMKLFDREHLLTQVAEIADIYWLNDLTTNPTDDFEKLLPSFSYLFMSWGSPVITKELLSQCPKLQFIGYAAGSMASIIPKEIFTASSITVINSNSILSKATAEGTFALMTLGAWRMDTYIDDVKQGVWSNNNQQSVLGLSGSTIGIIGYGKIAEELIRLLTPFSPRILLCSKHVDPTTLTYPHIECVSLNELLQSSDIISFHQTLTPSTLNTIRKEHLDLIRTGSLLINTARAAIINEADLIESLKENRYTACLDVFHREPLDVSSPLLSLPNVYCTPHIAAFSSYWKNRLADFVLENFLNWYHQVPFQGEINTEMYQRMTQSY